ncbi:MAG TPA: cbb3-type cytochrome c oxidase subunit II [Opitutaceae bacterium]
MNRIAVMLLGIFAVLALSWTGLVLSNQLSYGDLQPYVSKDDNKAYPEQLPGIAAQGKQVYQDLGCAYCHTQEVVAPNISADLKRGWGERQSFVRDYIREDHVLLGSVRMGPDLRNIGSRKPVTGRAYDEAWHYRHLYDPTSVSPNSNMPSYAFLFETRKIVGERSPNAVAFGSPKEGYEIVPSARAEALVAYLLSLKNPYNYPEEAKKIYVSPKGEGKEGAAASKKETK